MDTTKIATREPETQQTHDFVFGLPTREYLSGEALDRFLAKCYLRIEQWAREIEAAEADEEKNTSHN